MGAYLLIINLLIVLITVSTWSICGVYSDRIKTRGLRHVSGSKRGVFGTGQVKRGVLGTGQARKGGGGVLGTGQVKKWGIYRRLKRIHEATKYTSKLTIYMLNIDILTNTS